MTLAGSKIRRVRAIYESGDVLIELEAPISPHINDHIFRVSAHAIIVPDDRHIIEYVDNARFWTFIEGEWVKITLRPLQTLEYNTGHSTEEGYYAHSETYTHTGIDVECQEATWGRDCDGRYEQHNECKCPIERLREVPVVDESPEILRPAWGAGSSSQRDYTAEAAGY